MPSMWKLASPVFCAPGSARSTSAGAAAQDGAAASANASAARAARSERIAISRRYVGYGRTTPADGSWLLHKHILMLRVGNREPPLAVLIGKRELIPVHPRRDGDECDPTVLIALRRHLAAPAAEVEPLQRGSAARPPG